MKTIYASGRVVFEYYPHFPHAKNTKHENKTLFIHKMYSNHFNS